LRPLRSAVLQGRFGPRRDGSDGRAQLAEIVVRIEDAENEGDCAQVMLDEASGGYVGVASARCIKDAPVFRAAVVPTPESAETYPIALQVVGQLADLGADSWPGGGHEGVMERAVGPSESGLIADAAGLDRRSPAVVQRGDALAVAELGRRHVQPHGCRDRRSVRQRYCARKVCTPVTILHGSDVSQSGYLASSFGPRVATISSAS